MIALTCFIFTLSGQSTNQSDNGIPPVTTRHLVTNPIGTEFLLCQTFTVTLVTDIMAANETFSWVTSSNLQIMSGQGSLTITVKATGLGPALVQLNNNINGTIIQYSVNMNIVVFSSSHTTIYTNYSTTGNMIVPEDSYISGTFRINAGHTVYMGSTVYCTPNASIIISAGGKLILEGGTLTSLCSTEMWQGITVLGNYSELSQNPSYHGTLELRKASIENARRAIYVNDDRSSVGTGGIVTAEYSSFINNQCVVDYHPYKRYDIFNNEADNLSYFTNCRFIIDSNNNFDTRNKYVLQLVRLNGVKGIKFKGCEFSNSMNTTSSQGTAIYAYNANFMIDEYCSAFGPIDNCGNCHPSSSVRSTFYGFAKAVDVTNGGEYNFHIDHTDFSYIPLISKLVKST